MRIDFWLDGTITSERKFRCNSKRQINFLHILAVLSVVFIDAARAVSDDGQILLAFRESIVDDLGVLQDWLESDALPCSWTGVTCNDTNAVIGLDLSNMNLTGLLPGTLCQLPSLTSLELQENLFTGFLPPGLFNCTRLLHLDLSSNNFTGTIPDGISGLQSLMYLNLSMNEFNGVIPPGIGQLSELLFLDMIYCGVNGKIVDQIGNLTKLTNVSLSWNSFAPGNDLRVMDTSIFTGGLPSTFAKLWQLESLECASCHLLGSIPPWLGSLSGLDYIDLSYNDLSGSIPPSLMRLPKLTRLELYKNRLTGTIPTEIWNLTSLTDLDLSDNLLVGSIPDNITQLEHLGLIHLQNNSLNGEIPQGLVNLHYLYDLKLFMNDLTGSIPPALGGNCTLLQFDVSTNHLSGVIPSGLCNGGKLWRFILFSNSFFGNLPEAYGNCSSLIRFRIYGNMFDGTVPSGLWGSPNLRLLEIYDNFFEGSIPPTVGNATSLTSLKVYNNQLSGTLPPELGKLRNLDSFFASRNRLSGVIPQQLGDCGPVLTNLYIDGNALSQQIPSEIGNLSKLGYLSLASNQLSGPIPPEIGHLASLVYLDLSENKLSGAVPDALGELNLLNFISFNLSFNNLSGILPSALSVNLFSLGFKGNPNLCILDSNVSTACHDMSQTASSDGRKQPGLLAWTVGGILGLAVAIAVTGSWFFYKRHKAYLAHSHSQSQLELLSSWILTSFHKLSISYEEIMECLDEDNVIGSGGAGKVYKATLRNGMVVAVKKLWGDGKGDALHDHGFRAEVETLGSIRHRNIVKLLCSCSNKDANLLIYEYMPNGSLGERLHSNKGSLLDWSMRYKMAVGAAQGLAYLHHDCVPQILHRDVKSNNILLDHDYEAHMADFGLAKALKNMSMSAVAGSYGYIAPEYAYTLKVNEKSDIYSFGVVLLELVTGKRPIEPVFGDGVDIVKWVSTKLQTKEGLLETLDPRVGVVEQKMVLLLKVALFCTQTSPLARPSMRRVVEMLLEIDPQQRDGKGGKETLSNKSLYDSKCFEDDLESW